MLSCVSRDVLVLIDRGWNVLVDRGWDVLVDRSWDMLVFAMRRKEFSSSAEIRLESKESLADTN